MILDQDQDGQNVEVGPIPREAAVVTKPTGNDNGDNEDSILGVLSTPSSQSTPMSTSILLTFWHRPRVLYTAVFVWISVTGGRFLAEFLEQEVELSTSQIGGLLALQKFVGVLSSSIAGQIADVMEERHGRNKGRIGVLGCGVVVSTICFCLHGCHRIFGFDTNSFGDKVFNSLPWYILLRILYAVAGSFVYPVMDAVCMDFLKREGRQQDYGKERLYGAISWAATNLLMGPCLDHTQDFAILYPMSVVAMVGVLVCLHLYADGTTVTTYNASSIGLPIHPGMKRRTSDLITDNDDEDHQMQNDSNTKITKLIHDKCDSHETQNCSLGGNTDTIDDRTQQQQQRGNRLEFLSVFMVFGSSLYSIGFLIALVTLASGQAVVNDLVFLLFEYLGSTYSLMSLTVVLTVAFEIPLFQIAPALLDKFGSSGLMIMACLCYMVRVVGYTLIPAGKTAWVLLLEPMHGYV
jgi:Na+/melibiose symporter-like transporter